MLTQEFDLNIIPDSAPVVVHVNQYDIGEGRLIISLLDEDSTPYNPSSGATVAIQGMKPDTHGFDYAASLAGNVVTADVTEQMTAAAGTVRCQVVVSEGGNVTGTFVFFLEVQRSALPADSDMSASDYQLVQEMIDAAEQAEGDASESAQAAAASARAAATSESNSEAWAVGTRDGEPVPSTDETYHNNSKYYAERAAVSETNAAASEANAAQSETNAGISEVNAAASETNAAASEINAASSAEAALASENNAAASERNAAVSEANAAESEENAATSEANAAQSESNSEAWAVGQRGGEDVPSTDDTYHNNSKYWAEQAAQSAARSGHTILDLNGTPYTARTRLKFLGSIVEDDADADSTIVNPAVLPLYMMLHNDLFAPLMTEDNKLILTDDDNVIFAEWQYEYK